ncbi:hypothetical protein FHR24_000896 [Wenyingzhuangia heitensis]|uniref:DUF4374 domain-containing protein n=1 Tax=Wenyingzhuangia heitensis TaxID=1487859 RepID=A0ABX0U6P2_9FLAO|nr:DUF4374 domain-containing protein [Wenyingzhuangia heitensis]NIJ44457.1 hypothetical protein [Wenyingzhuangia heitensis]
MKKQILSIAFIFATVLFSCSKDDNPEPVENTSNLAVSLTSSGGEAPDALLSVDNFINEEISSIGSGIQQPGGVRRLYYQVGKTIISSKYEEGGTAIGYRFVDGELTEIGEVAANSAYRLFGKADETTLIAVEAAKTGLEKRVFNVINTENMGITKRVETSIEEIESENLISWPSGMIVRGDKLFLSYFLVHNENFSTPNSDEARVAVYNYPELTLDKIIRDDRAADIGIYGNFNGLITTENGDIYTYSSSSYASGYSPKPTLNSAILKIKNNETDFDSTYYLDFETISEGNKINFMHYAGNNKVIVRMVTDDSGLWATYAPTSSAPVCKIAIVDLITKTVTEVSEIPLHGGQWSTPATNYNGKVYMNISDSNGAYIYEIDPITATAVKSPRTISTEVRGLFNLN